MGSGTYEEPPRKRPVGDIRGKAGHRDPAHKKHGRCWSIDRASHTKTQPKQGGSVLRIMLPASRRNATIAAWPDDFLRLTHLVTTVRRKDVRHSGNGPAG